jgi:lipopolysaccharide heptosyltransferase II
VHDFASPPHILAVRLSSIGDVLLTTPLLRALRRRHPRARLSVLTKQAYAPLLTHNPHVTRVIGLAPGRNLMDLAAELRGERYSHLLDLHESMRTRLLRILVPGNWSGYPKHRVARAVLIQTKRDAYPERRPVAERYFAAARALDVEPDGRPPELFWSPEAECTVTTWLGGWSLPESARIVAVAPGAAHATKQWPLRHYRALIQRLMGDGWNVVLVGGEQDRGLASELAGMVGSGVVNAAGQFNLQQTASVLKRASALISGDTGVMHMATAVGTPVVALFGPTVQAFGFFPYSDRAEVEELALGCRPCSSKGGPRCPLGHHRCLEDLMPDRVHDAVLRAMS